MSIPSEPFGTPLPEPGAYDAPNQYALPPAPYTSASAPTDRFAVPAMVVGIVSLVGVLAYGLGALLAPVALVLGRRSLRRIRLSQGRVGGHGMAMAGFVMGVIGTILLAVLLLGVVVAIAIPVYLNARQG